MSLTPEERVALERMRRDAKKPVGPATKGVRKERFCGDPIGLDDEGKLFPAPAPAAHQKKALARKQ